MSSISNWIFFFICCAFNLSICLIYLNGKLVWLKIELSTNEQMCFGCKTRNRKKKNRKMKFWAKVCFVYAICPKLRFHALFIPKVSVVYAEHCYLTDNLFSLYGKQCCNSGESQKKKRENLYAVATPVVLWVFSPKILKIQQIPNIRYSIENEYFMIKKKK